MSYIEGFLTPVPTARKAEYIAFARASQAIFREFGAIRIVEAWGDDVPHGKVNDFWGAVQAKSDETVLFSWIAYPDKATRDAAVGKMMTDPRMKALGDMPFDGSRMIFGGFVPIVDDSAGKGATYIDGFLLAVPDANKDAYREMAAKASIVFRDHGALRVVEGWGDDIPEGKVTDFHSAAHAKEGETIVFSWIEWPDKAARMAGMGSVMADERMKTQPADMPFDGSRMMYGGFALVLDG